MERSERLKLRRERKKMESMEEKFSEAEYGSKIEPVYTHQMQKILVEKMTRIERMLTVLVKIECSRAGLDYEEVLK